MVDRSQGETPAQRKAGTKVESGLKVPGKPPLAATEPLHDGARSHTGKPGPDRLAATSDSPPADDTKHFEDSTTADPAAKAAGSTEEFAPGQVIGDFRIDAKLGQGGMGAVYKAHQISMDRTVALKLLSKGLASNQDFVARFRREAQTMAKVDHPNIVRGFAVGEVNGQHYVAMEFIDGRSMQRWMDKLGKIPVADAVHVALCCAYALEHAHNQGLVHRDIKPDNILMTGGGVVKVADLGLAKNTDDDMSLTQSGTGFGTPYYMPLEQYRDAKRVDARADIYALGITLYYMLTGKLPYYGETHFDVIKAKEAARFIPARRHNSDIPERLDLMIDKMIQKERNHRYQSCGEVIESLESLGLASAIPSFVGSVPAGGSKSGAPTVRVSTLPTRPKAAAKTAVDSETPELWVLRCTDEHGKKVKRQVSSGRLKQLIERDEVNLTSATVSRPGESTQRPLASIAEFSSLVQSKLVKAKADRRSQKLDNAYARLERDARRQRIFKALGSFFRNITGLAVIAALIAALALGGFWLMRNKQAVMQKVQDAAKSVQGAASKDAGQEPSPASTTTNP